jgi:hypothetical protein
MRQSSGSSSDIVDIIDIIRRKLRDSRTKIATVIQKCDEKDRNNDGLIHVDDLEDIFNEVMGTEYRITRRELKKFVNTFMFEKNNKVEYAKISDILEPEKRNEKEVRIEEKWLDNVVEEEDIRWATQPGIHLCVFVYYYICIYTYIYVCMYVLMYIYIHTYIYIYEYVYMIYVFLDVIVYLHAVYSCICIYLSVTDCKYICIVTQIEACIYSYLHKHMYKNIYVQRYTPKYSYAYLRKNMVLCTK